MQRLVQGIRRFRCTPPLPITIEDVHRQPARPQRGPGLLIRVRNLESLRKHTTDGTRHVSWVLRNITDPDAINSTMRVAAVIRWFYGDSDHDPPFNLIVSTFEACFDSDKQLYPGMRDQAYFSAWTILQISIRARARSHERASNYPIPAVSSSLVQHNDHDLHHVIRMLECNFTPGKPTLDFPRMGTGTYAHPEFVTNLFVDLTYAGSIPTLKSYESYLSAALTGHEDVIANILLMWYMFLGGHVEEETIWAYDRWYVMVSWSFLPFSPLRNVCTSKSLETILRHLSTRVINAFTDGVCLRELDYLLEFLAMWKERPLCLTPIAYQWCSAISEAAGRYGRGPSTNRRTVLQKLRPKPGGPALYEFSNELRLIEEEFSEVGRRCNSLRLDVTSRSAHGRPQDPAPDPYDLLPVVLEIGFRLATTGRDQPAPRLIHTSHHDRMFEIAFSSNDDRVIVDAMSVWTVGGDWAPPGSCVRYLAKRVERDTPFSPRLRRESINAIERIQSSELEVSGPETIRLLNRLDVGVGDMVDKGVWMRLLIEAICLPAVVESLSSYYWRLLGELVLGKNVRGCNPVNRGSRNVQVMKSLEQAEGWEELEVWIMVMWQSLDDCTTPPSIVEDVGQATLK